MLECLTASNEVKLIVFEKNLSLVNAIEGTHLKKLENSIGEVNTIVAICYLLNRFNASFNFGKTLSSEQSAMLASDIVEKYPYETIEDVVLMLKQVRQGIIGDGKDYKLDGQNVLTKWFPEYLDRKYAEVERQNKKQRDDLSAQMDSKDHPVTLYYEKQARIKRQKEKDEAARKEIDEMVKSMDRQMLEDTIKDWERKPEMSPYLDYLKRKRQIIK